MCGLISDKVSKRHIVPELYLVGRKGYLCSQIWDTGTFAGSHQFGTVRGNVSRRLHVADVLAEVLAARVWFATNWFSVISMLACCYTARLSVVCYSEATITDTMVRTDFVLYLLQRLQTWLKSHSFNVAMRVGLQASIQILTHDRNLARRAGHADITVTTNARHEVYELTWKKATAYSYWPFLEVHYMF